MNKRYAFEKFSQAVNELCTGEGEIRLRLVKAGEYICLLTADDITENCKQEFIAIQQALTKENEFSAYRGKLWAAMTSTRKTKKETIEFQALAGKIFNLYEF